MGLCCTKADMKQITLSPLSSADDVKPKKLVVDNRMESPNPSPSPLLKNRCSIAFSDRSKASYRLAF